MVGALGQVAGALFTLAAVIMALWQTYRANQAERRARQAADKARQRLLYRALLIEVRENRHLLANPPRGYSMFRLHRAAWEVARAELFGLPPKALELLQEAYQLASKVNDVVEANLAVGPQYPLIGDEYKQLTGKASERFELADQDLTDFLCGLGEPVRADGLREST